MDAEAFFAEYAGFTSELKHLTDDPKYGTGSFFVAYISLGAGDSDYAVAHGDTLDEAINKCHAMAQRKLAARDGLLAAMSKSRS